MTRRQAREQAFCLLFEQAVGGAPMEEILQSAQEARDFVPGSYAEEAALGAEQNQENIDKVIGEATGFPDAEFSGYSSAIVFPVPGLQIPA